MMLRNNVRQTALHEIRLDVLFPGKSTIIRAGTETPEQLGSDDQISTTVVQLLEDTTTKMDNC